MSTRLSVIASTDCVCYSNDLGCKEEKNTVIGKTKVTVFSTGIHWYSIIQFETQFSHPVMKRYLTKALRLLFICSATLKSLYHRVGLWSTSDFLANFVCWDDEVTQQSL